MPPFSPVLGPPVCSHSPSANFVAVLAIWEQRMIAGQCPARFVGPARDDNGPRSRATRRTACDLLLRERARAPLEVAAYDAEVERPVMPSPRVVLLESRMSRELARLVEKHGGTPICVPAVRQGHELSPEAAGDLVTCLSPRSDDTGSVI